MSQSNSTPDGGQAFPSPAYTEPSGDFNWGAEGMSLRDYFIAHAPAEPQRWFSPMMATTRPAPKWRDENGCVYASAFEAERAVGEDGFSNANASAQNEWDEERAKQQHVQWPAAWADAMLKARQS